MPSVTTLEELWEVEVEVEVVAVVEEVLWKYLEALEALT